MHRPQPINQLRELVQQLEHLNRVQSPIINYTRQALAWQFPEKAHSKTDSTKVGNVPPLWGWLAQRETEVHPQSYKSITKIYQQSIAVQLGLEIDPIVRLHADWLCDINLEEQRLEALLKPLVNHEQFKTYNQVFNQFNFGLRIRSRLLSRIYPFEAFLTNGKQLIEREVMCRMNFWQYVITKIEINNRLPNNPIGEEIALYKESLKSNVDASGKQLLNGKHLQAKLGSKVANMLFRELSRAIAKL